MGDGAVLASGVVLAHRYELQDLVSERLGSTTWRAHDRVLSRNVGVELIRTDDPRADQFVEAARRSTTVADPRFLRVLDLLHDEQGHHAVVREWARAFPLDQLLAQSSLPPHRAAAVVAEVAEALAHAHERGVYHRRLTPHHVLLKQSGAVRVVGLGVASALSPAGHHDSVEDLHAYEALDVQSLGRLLYACLVSRWPGSHVDQLRAAPTLHGKLLRPRQVKAGVTRDVDTVCDRILGRPPQHHRTPLRTAADVARSLRLAGVDEEALDDQPSLIQSSSDVLRADPVVEPSGPPPGLEPPRRRPKAFEPAPPTTLERGKARAKRATKGDRGLVLLGVVITLLIGAVLALLVNTAVDDAPAAKDRAAGVERSVPIRAVRDLDPFGEDRRESPDEIAAAIDDDPQTAWRTSTYFGSPRLGGLKPGVGLVLDLGRARDVRSVRVQLLGEGTALSVYTARPGVDQPTSIDGMIRRGTLRDAGSDASFAFSESVLTRYVVVWLTRLPEVGDGEYRGGVREVTIRGMGTA